MVLDEPPLFEQTTTSWTKPELENDEPASCYVGKVSSRDDHALRLEAAHIVASWPVCDDRLAATKDLYNWLASEPEGVTVFDPRRPRKTAGK